MFDIESDMRVADGIAKMFAPMKTGNLRFNAIKSNITYNGFRIRYSLSDAYYIYFLEEGTKKMQMHVGFISNRTVPAIAYYLFSKYDEYNKKEVNKIKRLSKNAQTNDAYSLLYYRGERHKKSLGFDLETVSKQEKWEHDVNNEVFDTNWKRGDMF